MRLALILLLAACGSRGFLPGKSTASCRARGECVIPFCPDACNGGQPVCQVPRSYEYREARSTCPCLYTPMAKECRPPAECAQPGCFVPEAEGILPDCVDGRCVTRLLDGGIVR